METVTVTIKFDLARLNEFLGNTPTVAPHVAMAELLDSLFREGQDCPVCSEPIHDGPALIGCYVLTKDAPESVTIPLSLARHCAAWLGRAHAEGAHKETVAPQHLAATLAALERRIALAGVSASAPCDACGGWNIETDSTGLLDTCRDCGAGRA